MNSKPHIGHAFEFIIADIIARHARAKKQVFFNVGIDEHGIKVQQAAERENLDPQIYCNKLAEDWKRFCSWFEISYDNFYRTTDDAHKELTVRIFQDFITRDFCYKDIYKGKYCIGCETFITEKEVVDNKCPIHQTELQDLNEENYFFKLSYFRDRIKDILANNNLSKELKAQAENFNEISITRKNVDWGVKIPGSDDTLYVWFEALLNYCLALTLAYPNKKEWEEFWSNSLIICGPDNLKFQAYILQAINLALDLPQNKEVLVHSVILDDKGKKMSKTVGNVVDPFEQSLIYGVSPVRFYLGLGLSTTGQANYSETDLINLWNSQIVDGLGNSIARVLHLIDIKGIDINEPLNETYQQFLNVKESRLDFCLEHYHLNDLRDELNDFVTYINRRINDEKPFSKDCKNPEAILNECYHGLKLICKYYSYIIPSYTQAFFQAFEGKKKVILFNKLEKK